MMDLGSTVCTRSRPRCGECPLGGACQARRLGRPGDFPAPRPRRSVPVRETRMLMVRNPRGEVWLERRPPTGIWGGLWSFPELAGDDAVADWCLRRLGCVPRRVESWPVVRHTFTHFHLDITPVLAPTENPAPAVLEADQGVWYNSRAQKPGGLAAPVRRLLDRLEQNP